MVDTHVLHGRQVWDNAFGFSNRGGKKWGQGGWGGQEGVFQLQLIAQLEFQEDECDFPSWSWNTRPALCLRQILEGVQPIFMCFVDFMASCERCLENTDETTAGFSAADEIFTITCISQTTNVKQLITMTYK